MAADFIARLKSGLAKGLAGVNEVLADPDNEIVSHQLEDTRATLPVLALFHLIAILAYCYFVMTSLPLPALAVWAGLGLMLEIVMVAGYFALGRRRAQAFQAQKVLRFGPLLGLAITLYWLWASVGNA